MFSSGKDDFVEQFLIYKAKDRRSQILSSMADTARALNISSISEETRKYLEVYYMELEEELTVLGFN